MTTKPTRRLGSPRRHGDRGADAVLVSYPARMRRWVLAFAVLLCLPAGAEARVPRDFFGVMANGALDRPGFALDAESRRMRRAGIGTERIEVAWDLTEPERGRYDFALTDRKVLAASRAGLDVLALVVRSPSWAAADPEQPFSPPRDPADYARFLRTLVARYGPNGSLWRAHPDVRPRPVRAWQVWNEPNLAIFWSVQPFMRRYATLLDTAYRTLKRADRRATVVMAGLANFSWRDLQRLFDTGGRRLRFDVAAVHPFSGRPSNSVRIVGLNRAVLDRHGARRKPIWLTELTWSSGVGRKPKVKSWETTEAGQARRLTEAYALYARARKRLRLGRIYWYTWVTGDRDARRWSHYAGLRTLRPDGRIVDKPAMGAFRAIVRKLRR
jgi:Beta-galactosidase